MAHNQPLYLATKCLEYIAKQIKSSLCDVVEAIREHFYMDDLMTGHVNVVNAVRLEKGIHDALKSYHFSLRKYQSNSQKFLESIDRAYRQIKYSTNRIRIVCSHPWTRMASL